MNGQNLTKFCIHIFIDKIYFGIVKRYFSQICRPLIEVRNWFLLNILRINGHNLTYFCIHILDKIYVGIVKHHFSQIYNIVTALHLLSLSAKYLENEWTEFNQIMLQCELTGF